MLIPRTEKSESRRTTDSSGDVASLRAEPFRQLRAQHFHDDFAAQGHVVRDEHMGHSAARELALHGVDTRQPLLEILSHVSRHPPSLSSVRLR